MIEIVGGDGAPSPGPPPVVAPSATPVTQPVVTPVVTPVVAPAAVPVTAPVPTPVVAPVATPLAGTGTVVDINTQTGADILDAQKSGLPVKVSAGVHLEVRAIVQCVNAFPPTRPRKNANECGMLTDSSTAMVGSYRYLKELFYLHQ